jgi:hypothetical protein
MKRLDRTYRRRVGDLAAVVDEQRWRAYAERLRRVGIPPAEVRDILERATRDRKLFEDVLEAMAEKRKDNRLRRELRAVDRARKLVDFLRERAWFFGSTAADELDARLGDYRFEVRLPIEPDLHSGRRLRSQMQLPIDDLLSPRGRRREIWAERAVVDIARLYRERGLAWNRVVTDAHAALALFGHADVISRVQVHHIIRRARRRDPGLGGSPRKQRS